MTKQEIIKAIQDNKIQIKASTDAKFATIRWFDNESQTWKESNTFIRDVIQGASNFADLENDTHVDGQNGQEVINNLNDLLNFTTNQSVDNTKDIFNNTQKINEKVDEKVENTDGSKTEILRFSANDSINMAHTKAPGEVDSNGANSIRLAVGSYSDHEQIVLRVGDINNSPIDYVPTHVNSMVNKGYVDNTTKINLVKFDYTQTTAGYVEFQVDASKYPNGIQGTVALKQSDETDCFRAIPFFVQKGMIRINIPNDGRGSAYMYHEPVQDKFRFGFNTAVVSGTIQAMLTAKEEDCALKVQHPTRQTEEAE